MTMVRAIIALRHGYRNPGQEWANHHKLAVADKTRSFIRSDFAGALPELLAENAENLGLQPSFSRQSLRVRFEDFDSWDINVPNLLVEIEFSGDSPVDEDCERILACLKEIFDTWFRNRKHEPDNHEVEISWKKSYRM